MKGDCRLCSYFVSKIRRVLCVHIVSHAVDGKEGVIHTVLNKIENVVNNVVIVKSVAGDIEGRLAVVDYKADRTSVAMLRVSGVEGDSRFAPYRVGRKQNVIMVTAEFKKLFISVFGCENRYGSVGIEKSLQRFGIKVIQVIVSDQNNVGLQIKERLVDGDPSVLFWVFPVWVPVFWSVPERFFRFWVSALF